MPGKIARCQWCKAPIAWFTSPFGGRLAKFDAKPVDGRTHAGAPAYPVENGRRAWRLPPLVEELQVRRETSREAAQDEAYDMPWHTLHDCPNNPHRSTTEQETDPR